MLGTGGDQDSKGPAHVSADDLNDGFVLDKDDRRLLSYKVRHKGSRFLGLSQVETAVAPRAGPCSSAAWSRCPGTETGQTVVWRCPLSDLLLLSLGC